MEGSLSMGKTSNAVKQKWNEKNYVQVKISVKPDLAASFKAACKTADKSMAFELSGFMQRYANQPQSKIQPSVNVKTLKDRRKAMGIIRRMIIDLIDAEGNYIDNTPESLHSGVRYEMAVERLEQLEAVLDSVDDIYND